MPRRPLLPGADVLVLALAGALTVLTVAMWGADLRTVNNALSVLVVALFTWRLLGTWRELTVLERALVILAVLGPLTASIASLGLLASTTHLPPNPWLWGVTAHRLGCVAVAVWWRRWLGRRHSPFRHGATEG